jgi:hypothetical protein
MCDFFWGAYCFEFSWNGIREINSVNNLKAYITLGKLKKKISNKLVANQDLILSTLKLLVVWSKVTSSFHKVWFQVLAGLTSEYNNDGSRPPYLKKNSVPQW